MKRRGWLTITEQTGRRGRALAAGMNLLRLVSVTECFGQLVKLKLKIAD